MSRFYQKVLTNTAALALLSTGCVAFTGTLNSHPHNSGQRTFTGGAMNFREDITKSVELAPGARVQVSSVAGPVSIETSNSNKAEIHIVRLAATQEELDCYTVGVDAAPNRLDIRYQQSSDRLNCSSIRSRQEIRLRLPRSANVELTGIAGHVAVGPIEGRLRLSGIAGQTELESVHSAAISGIAGPLSLKFASRGPWDAHISGISGQVDLAFQRGVSADIEIAGLMGSLRSMSPDIEVVEGDRHWVRVGSGGPRLSLSGINGPVRVRRY